MSVGVTATKIKLKHPFKNGYFWIFIKVVIGFQMQPFVNEVKGHIKIFKNK
jgi:hypothetical protein